MRSEWRLSTINEICSLVTDGAHNSPKSVINGAYMASVKDFTEYGLDFSSCRMISEEDYEKLRLQGCVPEFNDILVGKDGARYFEDIIIYKQPEKPALLSSIAILRTDRKKVIPEFLYYTLKSPSVRKDVRDNYGSGSAIPRIVLKDFKRMPIAFPPIDEQKKIVSIFVSIDEQIQNNNKINNNLEQQAQAIFKEWFIDNPQNNEWSTGTFSELIKSTLNGDWGKEAPTGNNIEKVYCIRGADIPEVKAGNKGKMPTRYILPKNFSTKQLTAGDIVVEISGGSPTQSTGRCTAITQSLLDRYDSGMVCTNFCKAMKPKEGYSLFIYYYWQYLYGKGIFFSYENGTTGIKNLDFSGFIETETILIPPVDKVIAFDDYCKSIFNQIFANGKQNEHLAVLRDALLPKLMSGELDVSNIDI